MKRIKCEKAVVDSYLCKALKDFVWFGDQPAIEKGKHWAEWVPHGVEYDPLMRKDYGDAFVDCFEVILVKELPKSRRTEEFLFNVYSYMSDICPGVGIVV